MHGALRRVVRGDATRCLWPLDEKNITNFVHQLIDKDEKMQEFGPSGIILLIFGGKIIGI